MKRRDVKNPENSCLVTSRLKQLAVSMQSDHSLGVCRG